MTANPPQNADGSHLRKLRKTVKAKKPRKLGRPEVAKIGLKS